MGSRRVDLSRPVFFLAHTPQYIYTYVEISPTWSNKHNPPYRGVYEDVQQVVSVTVTNYCCAENRDSKVMLPTDFSEVQLERLTTCDMTQARALMSASLSLITSTIARGVPAVLSPQTKR